MGRDLLKLKKVFIIGVWEAGGVGKTTLVTNLNNELLKTGVLSRKLSFGVVIWVTVTKPPIDIRQVQAQIASRLNMKIDSEGSDRSIASKICERLEEETSFLLIMDDVGEAINLDDVGVPQLSARSKVIITSRFLSVCCQMKTDVEMKVYTLDEDKSWQLFDKNVGDIVNQEQIYPLAKEIARECDGLPLAIIVIGSSMRGKTRVELWKDALKSLRMSEPHSKVVEDKDIELSSEQRSKRVNKKRGDIQSCFLYCSLYPAAIPIDDLIQCCWAEGILGEHDTYEEAYNRGITLIESLKDDCLLEDAKMKTGWREVVHYVKMHDVVRDVSRWIASTFGDEHTSVFQAGIGLTEVSSSIKRISFISNKTECLTDCFTKCPKTTSLLLQVCQLHAVILQNCYWLKELPPIGNLHSLQVLDCDDTMLSCLPHGMDNLTNLRLLNMPVSNMKSISKGFFLKFPSIEMLNMWRSCLRAISFDEISSLHNLIYLFIRVDSSSFFNRDYTWMTRLKRFHIRVGEYSLYAPYNKSKRVISVYECDIFSNGELSVMLQFASDLYLEKCRVEGGSGQFDPLPNLEYIELRFVENLKSVSDFGQYWGLRFSKLRQLVIYRCESLTCLFKDGGACSVPKHMEEITRVRKLKLFLLPELGTLGEPQSMWEHLEELNVSYCDRLRKLPLSIQTSNNIKVIKEYHIGGANWNGMMITSSQI
ncbi:disease resistance protein At4g27190-like [Capsicum annuum]|uniref:disease resistance protein At4g27190-like n=1 Tax=Capsicum annuum TaxID=4072 RepID=UPI001FB0E60D|nr:disease resistance protein At4g27190-like [Capsicum annuum]